VHDACPELPSGLNGPRIPGHGRCPPALGLRAHAAHLIIIKE
jgi:hypothetical protein